MLLTAEAVPDFHHLNALSDKRGLLERALRSTNGPEDGYCVDDVARALVVVCREPRPAPTVSGLVRLYLDFVLDALDPSGLCRNRMSIEGEWRDEPTLGDSWGRSLWALGVAAVADQSSVVQNRALAGFKVAAKQRSSDLRPAAFAALGAAHVVERRPEEQSARALLVDSLATIWWDDLDATWIWPEPRLGRANGMLAEAMIFGGHVIDDSESFCRGLEMLEFLLALETQHGHVSITPVGGRGPLDNTPGFVQRPLEVAALVDACATAYRVTMDPRWQVGIDLGWRWFCGDNDANLPMFDAETGAGYDGLNSDGRDLAQGAESTLAMLATSQHARTLGRRDR
jgi:hypothetical protein